jgi:hypothetical protein
MKHKKSTSGKYAFKEMNAVGMAFPDYKGNIVKRRGKME